MQRRRRVQRFARRFGERAVIFRVSKKKNRFHKLICYWEGRRAGVQFGDGNMPSLPVFIF